MGWNDLASRALKVVVDLPLFGQSYLECMQPSHQVHLCIYAYKSTSYTKIVRCLHQVNVWISSPPFVLPLSALSLSYLSSTSCSWDGQKLKTTPIEQFEAYFHPLVHVLYTRLCCIANFSRLTHILSLMDNNDNKKENSVKTVFVNEKNKNNKYNTWRVRKPYVDFCKWRNSA